MIKIVIGSVVDIMFKKYKHFLFVFLFLIAFIGCKKDTSSIKQSKELIESEKLFVSLSSNQTGVNFVNQLKETLDYNYFKYSYSYIGGGVATADFNNDGLDDLFFISNSFSNKLYLNKGNLKFEDITQNAGIKKRTGFDTGVSVADINNDGFLDIYISRGGFDQSENKFANMLYINNGDLTFTEKAEEFGLADTNRTVQAIFFDFDNDNDLDVYLSNTPNVTGKSKVLNLNEIEKSPKALHTKGSDRLYKNDGKGQFIDVTEASGIHYDIGFGLNPIVGDINNDGWLDLYVCNDFNYPDLVYINNKNGTFSEKRDEVVKHMSFNSMGSDFADINNDGYLDLMTLDMNPEDYVRSKTTMTMTSVSKFNAMVKNGYHHQYMHNMLQLNNGNGTFREISQLSGIANTDWSWSLLSADFDLDGFNDIYITNGVFRDVMDRDVHNKTLEILRANKRRPTDSDLLSFTQMIPQQKLNNYFFKNNGDLTFKKVSEEWTTSVPTFSNGAAYSDLDNDGDLDIVVNNINDEATILKNNASDLNKGDYLKIQIKGPLKNPFGLGTSLKLHYGNNKTQVRELINTKGFLSTVSNTVHFGIPKNSKVNGLEVIWPDGKVQEIHDFKTNGILEISYSEATIPKKSNYQKTTSYLEKAIINTAHLETPFNDYDLQVLLPHKLSQTGPSLAKGDINGDNLEDIFVGGGANQSGQILLGKPDGSIKAIKSKTLELDKSFEDQGASFFDADNDGDLDLYVVSGSYQFSNNESLLQDRLYLNDGNGQFKKSNGLPKLIGSGSVITPSDYDNDGDIDLFVGGRVIPGKYPLPAKSYLLINNNGSFSIETPNLAPELENIGLVTDATWIDINNDEKQDLIVSGEWMGIYVFINEDNKLVKSNAHNSLTNAVGWWNKLLIADIDNDGDSDIIAGNLGLNYKFHTSEEKPFQIYTTDFDFNGTQDVILAKDYNGKEVPVRGKTCMTQQIPGLAKAIPNYNDFASRNLEGILGNGIDKALNYKASEFRSGIFINNNGNFTFEPFENLVQTSLINSILFEDMDRDGNNDILLAGNNYLSEVETTRADAGIGLLLKGDGKGNYHFVNNIKSGFFADKDVRDMALVKMGQNRIVFVANNNSKHDVFKLKN